MHSAQNLVDSREDQIAADQSKPAQVIPRWKHHGIPKGWVEGSDMIDQFKLSHHAPRLASSSDINSAVRSLAPWFW